MTAAPFTKPVPFTVSVNAAPPVIALFGERDEIVGSGLFTVKFAEDDVPPPGAGFVTVTGNMPPVARSVARIDAVTFVALTNVVVSALPLKFTTAPLTKPVPFTVSVNPAPPSVVFVGETELIVGGGLFTVKFAGVDGPPPGAGLITVTGSVPPAAISVARIEAFTWVALTNAVVRALPLKFTTAPVTKFVPFTVSVNAAPPDTALNGENELIAGTGLSLGGAGTETTERVAVSNRTLPCARTDEDMNRVRTTSATTGTSLRTDVYDFRAGSECAGGRGAMGTLLSATCL